jgi:hypothetical protein
MIKVCMVWVESFDMRIRLITIDNRGITGTRGHLNPLQISGLFFRSMMMDSARNMNAERAPTFTSSNIDSMGKNAEIRAAITPMTRILPDGALDFSCTLEKNSGSKPSRDIAKVILVCPKRLTRITVVSPAMAPNPTIERAHPTPTCSNAVDTGAGLFRKV